MIKSCSIPNARLTPVIRWAGSKRSILSQIIPQVPNEFGTYIEPFLGSACLFFALCPPKAILGDMNSDLINLYQVIRNHPIRLLNRALTIPASKSEYYRQRSEKVSPSKKFLSAVRFLYLNRYCFNGLYRTNKAGEFNVPFGSRTGSLPSAAHMKKASEQLKRAQLLNADFEETLQMAKKGDFVYLDPPYASAERNGRNEYGACSFSNRDLPRLISALHSLEARGVSFLLSYGLTREIQETFPKGRWAMFRVKRQIAAATSKRGYACEILASNKQLFGRRKV